MMSYLRVLTNYRSLIISLLLTALHSQHVFAEILQSEENTTSGIEGYTHQQALQLGEQMYRNGVLPDGTTMQARVQGDIPADGQVFTCVLCHRRSGLGTSEGAVIALPVNGLNLFRSRVEWDARRRHSGSASAGSQSRQVPTSMLGDDLRQPYNAQTLSRAIRNGIDPDDRILDELMPRYDLNDSNMALLIYYLKNLTRTLSPSVTKEKIHFATIITEGVAETDKMAMLNVLETVVADRNSQTRNQIKRAEKGAFIRRELDSSYRTLELSIWELTGPPQTWRKQLEEYNRQQPVFAILGGISNADWAPIHAFSEQHELPVIFPITDQPVISSGSTYTLYFSKGLYQEGESVASYIRRQVDALHDVRIIQVYKKGTEGEVVARGFEEKWKRFSTHAVLNYELDDASLKNNNAWRDLIEPGKKTFVLLWVGDAQPALSGLFADHEYETFKVFVSSTLLKEDYASIADEYRDRVYITYPYAFPEEKKRNLASLETWLKIKGIPEGDQRIQSKMYFLGWMLSDTLASIKSEFYRDYFMEKIEMMKDQTHSISVYPRLSFGPGQRYASKGCYIAQITKGASPHLQKISDWIVN